jgi:hypothetical protein
MKPLMKPQLRTSNSAKPKCLYYLLCNNKQVELTLIRVHLKTGKAFVLAGKLPKGLTLDKLFNSKGSFISASEDLSATLLASHGSSNSVQYYIKNLKKKPGAGNRTIITDELIERVFTLKASSTAVKGISDSTGLSRQAVYNILNGKSKARATIDKSTGNHTVEADREALNINLDSYPEARIAMSLIDSCKNNIMSSIRAAVYELSDAAFSPLYIATTLNVSENMIIGLLGNEPLPMKLYRK